MSVKTITQFKDGAQLCRDIIQGLYSGDLENIEKKLNVCALKLEAAAKFFYDVERENELINVQEEFKHHQFMSELLNGNHKPEIVWETEWLHHLHHYMVIRFERYSPNGHLVFEKEGARVGGKKYYHNPEDLVPNARLNWEEGKVYLVYQENLKDYAHIQFKHSDELWTFAKELTENEAIFITKSLAPVFAKAKSKKIKY
jgi:hypothetical protein